MRSAFVSARAALLLVVVTGLADCNGSGAGSWLATAQAANDAQWIWTSAQQNDVPAGACYFRKTFELKQPESGEVQITADDAYQLFVNGRLAGEGNDWHVLNQHNITKYLTPGRNTVAVKVTNVKPGNAGLAARVIVQNAADTHVVYPTDASWKVSQQEFPHWTKSQFNDVQWLPPRVIGPLGVAAPWLDEVQLAGGAPAGRFQPHREFRVDTVAQPEQTGSLIALTFNEFGELLVSREQGPLLLLRDADRDGVSEQVVTACDQVTGCQGILPLNGMVFVTGKGPDGAGLYKLSDLNRDGVLEQVETLIKFSGEMTEHGPHAVLLGPDGFIYVVLGNHTKPEREADATSPYHHPYEGDLLSPRYEDPRGHAAGIKAPGGCVVRTDTDGSFMEMYAGGLRNAYDAAFNRHGELFTFDSDMEWDEGLPWYRPTRINHLVPGGEYGWRSGWAKWPTYYFDSLPGIADQGRGSPTGVVAYNHVMFPRRYHDALFVGDWTRGRILAVKLKPAGGTFTAETEVFCDGKPLNVTDLEVGPDGGLYFCTGGRDSQGGVYRIAWRGQVPAAANDLGKGIERAIRQPQLDSAWARQRLAAVKQELGQEWDKHLTALANNPAGKPEHRCRALELMQLFGPFPTGEQLTRLASDPDVQVRVKATFLLGIHAEEATKPVLVKLLHDKEPLVQRLACESLVRCGHKPPLADLVPLLESPDRNVTWAATRLLEQIPSADWQVPLLKSEKARVFLQGALALLVVSNDRGTVDAVLDRSRRLMQSFLTDAEFLDVLRLIEIALERGQLTGDDAPELRTLLAEEYPSGDPLMNRELLKLNAYLQGPGVAPRMIEQLRSELPNVEKLHLALMARFYQNWSTDQKLALLKFYEQARALPGGASLKGYIENVSRDFFVGLTDAERAQVLAGGVNWPSAALSVLAKLPPNPGQETLQQLIQLDRQLIGNDSEQIRLLGVGIVAVLARSGDEDSMAYLRRIYQTDPPRRSYVAMALSQQPDGDNWPLLIHSLPSVEGAFARDVLKSLAQVSRVPQDPEPVRQVILRGLKLGDNGGDLAVALLEKWTDQKLGGLGDGTADKLAAWQKWFSDTYPSEPVAVLPVDSGANQWTYDELLAYLNTPEAKTAMTAPESLARGAEMFTKAQCIKCHRYGELGEGLGPDLTTVARRFQTKEIIESILYPSLVISDQYASQAVLTQDGRTTVGIVAPQADNSVIVLTAEGTKVNIPRQQIDEITPSKTSAMPEGLLNGLTLEEIADLFTYLNQPPATNVSSRRPVINSR